MIVFEFEKLIQILNGESNQEKWSKLNLKNWIKSEKVSQIVSETGNLLKIFMDMVVWRLHANGYHSYHFLEEVPKAYMYT